MDQMVASKSVGYVRSSQHGTDGQPALGRQHPRHRPQQGPLARRTRQDSTRKQPQGRAPSRSSWPHQQPDRPDERCAMRPESLGPPSVGFGGATDSGGAWRLSLFGCADAAPHSPAKRDARFQVSHTKPAAIPAGGIASATMPRMSAPTALSCWKAAVSRHIEQPCADTGCGAASNSAAASARVRRAQRITAAAPARESCPGRSSRTSRRCKSPPERSRSWPGAGGRSASA